MQERGGRKQRTHASGAAATELLIEEVASPQGHRHRQVVFEPELVIRESTGG